MKALNYGRDQLTIFFLISYHLMPRMRIIVWLPRGDLSVPAKRHIMLSFLALIARRGGVWGDALYYMYYATVSTSVFNGHPAFRLDLE